MDAEFQEMVKKGKKTQQEVDGIIQLANEVQYAVAMKKLKPGELRLQSVLCIYLIISGFSDAIILQSNGIPTARRCTSENIFGYRIDDGPRG